MSSSNVSLIESSIAPASSPLVERHTTIDHCHAVWSQFGLRIPRVALFPDAVVPHSRYLREVFDVVDNGDVDAVLLTNDKQLFALDKFRSARDLFLVPVINVTGKSSPAADVNFNLRNAQSWVETASRIKQFSERRARLSYRFHSPSSPAVRMLAYLFVSGDDLTPVRQPDSPYYFAYKGFPNTRSTMLVAEALADKGWLERSFFDRHHECAGCHSHRLIVREECPACHSPNLSEVDLIHHYSCAKLSPEDDFRRGTALVCPKCSKQLRHYGKDYDKPGRVEFCGRCQKTTSEPAIGFVCQDCGMRVDGDAVNVTDVFSYSLSDQAGALLATETAEVEYFPKALLQAFPDELQRRVLQLSHSKECAPDFVVAEIQYGARDDLLRNKGEAAFRSMRKLLADNLQGLLGDNASVHSSHDRDYVLFLGVDETGLGAYSASMLNRSESVLFDKLHPTLLVLWSGREGTER
ncbi:hypothetical protein DEV91_105101 [Phyllobacterium brassicacearum]|nr:hypothetical protein DEV91_105101 [Phyllobacterium brassicacearum]